MVHARIGAGSLCTVALLVISRHILSVRGARFPTDPRIVAKKLPKATHSEKQVNDHHPPGDLGQEWWRQLG
jgi:hypothetical protein